MCCVQFLRCAVNVGNRNCAPLFNLVFVIFVLFILNKRGEKLLEREVNARQFRPVRMIYVFIVPKGLHQVCEHL